MRNVTIVFVFIICLLASGCGRSVAGNKTERQDVWQSAKTFPSFAAGTWQQKEGYWKIVIEPNGVVSSVVIPLSSAKIRPHQTTKVEMKDGSFSTFTGGDIIAECNPVTRELSVVVETREFHIRFLHNRIDGNRLDSFSGPVSQDGKIWKPGWIEIFDYGPEMPQDENDIFVEPIIFDKVASQTKLTEQNAPED